MPLLTSAMLMLASPLGAQIAGRPTYWGFVGIGGAAAADSGFYASSIGAAIQRGAVIGLARVSSLDTPHTKRLEEFGLLIGLASQRSRFHCGLAAGVGTVRDSRDSTAVSIPVEGQVTWRFTRWAGLGLRVYGSANDRASFAAYSVALQLGRLR
jgi:hypothetical protein